MTKGIFLRFSVPAILEKWENSFRLRMDLHQVCEEDDAVDRDFFDIPVFQEGVEFFLRHGGAQGHGQEPALLRVHRFPSEVIQNLMNQLLPFHSFS